MNMYLNGKVLASAAIATAAIATATLGAVAIVRKRQARAQHLPVDDEDTELTSNIGPGEINPYADTDSTSAKQR